MKWMAPPRTPAELAERDRVLKGRVSIGEPTVSINIGYGPDIPIFPEVAVMSRVTCGNKTCDRTDACAVHCTCVNCIAIPIGGTKMTEIEQKIAKLRADLADRDAEPVSIPTTRVEGGFDLQGQFTAPTVAAVMARNSEVRPEQPARAETKVSGQFDARAMWRNRAVHAHLPARDDFTDDHSNSAPDGSGETSESHRVGMASDYLNCEVSGESGPAASTATSTISSAL